MKLSNLLRIVYVSTQISENKLINVYRYISEPIQKFCPILNIFSLLFFTIFKTIHYPKPVQSIIFALLLFSLEGKLKNLFTHLLHSSLTDSAFHTTRNKAVSVLCRQLNSADQNVYKVESSSRIKRGPTWNNLF